MEKQIKVMYTLLNQIELYLNGKITRQTFNFIAEEYYTENADLIVNTKFHEVYSQIVPDACLFYIDEPGYEVDKEKCFHKEMEKAYELLKPLCDNL